MQEDEKKPLCVNVNFDTLSRLIPIAEWPDFTSSQLLKMPFLVKSPNVTYSDDRIESRYTYETSKVVKNGKNLEVIPEKTQYTFRTERRVPKLGVMLVGWGGNNGSTITAGILANKHGLTWNTKEGLKVSLEVPSQIVYS